MDQRAGTGSLKGWGGQGLGGGSSVESFQNSFVDIHDCTVMCIRRTHCDMIEGVQKSGRVSRVVGLGAVVPLELPAVCCLPRGRALPRVSPSRCGGRRRRRGACRPGARGGWGAPGRVRARLRRRGAKGPRRARWGRMTASHMQIFRTFNIEVLSCHISITLKFVSLLNMKFNVYLECGRGVESHLKYGPGVES